jgi:hypothetical protein
MALSHSLTLDRDHELPPNTNDLDGSSTVCKEATLLGEYPRLESVTLPTLTTVAAAFYLNRKPQTLRIWACYGGPIRPLRVYGRLAWPVSEIRRVLGVSQ